MYCNICLSFYLTHFKLYLISFEVLFLLITHNIWNFLAGYVDAFKEAQRRKSKPKPTYTIEDYRKFDSSFNFGKEIIDETDTDKVS